MDDACASCLAPGAMIWGDDARVCTACGVVDSSEPLMQVAMGERVNHCSTVSTEAWRDPMGAALTGIEHHPRVSRLLRELHAQTDDRAALRSSIRRDADIIQHIMALDERDDAAVYDSGELQRHAAVEETFQLAYSLKVEKWFSRNGGDGCKASSQRGRQRQVGLLMCYVEASKRHGRYISRRHALHLLGAMEHFKASSAAELARYYNAAERSMDALFNAPGDTLHELTRVTRAICLQLARRDRYRIAARALGVIERFEALGDSAQLFLQKHSMSSIACALLSRGAAHLRLTPRDITRVALRSDVRVTEKTVASTRSALDALLDSPTEPSPEPPMDEGDAMQRLENLLQGGGSNGPKVFLDVVDR
jgi:hypothetical protein